MLKFLHVLCYSALFASALHAQFTNGHIVVLQAGDGVTTLTNTGNPIILKEFSPAGVPGFSLAVPATGTAALVIRGNATSEGYLSRSADNNFIVFGAYMAALPNATVLNTSAATQIQRAIGLVNNAGTLIIGAASNATFAGSDMRAAAASNNAHFWANTASQGSSYFGSGSPTNIQSGKLNMRALAIFNGQLYASSQVTTGLPADIGVYAVGNGTPSASGQTMTTIINTGVGSQPGQFYFNAGNTICYVADARSVANGGGIQKWIYTANTWSLAYTLPTGTTSAGAFGVIADFNGNTPLVYATTTESSANRLIAISDIGANASFTTLATASASNTIFRGLAFAPNTSTCLPPVINTIAQNGPVCSNAALQLSVTVGGTAPFTYTWSGAGQINSMSIANPTVLNATSGAYSVTVSNGCGTATAAVNVSVNAAPTLQVNSATICTGGTATLSASGATSYTWSNGANTSSIVVSPTVNTNYTISGSANGCIGVPINASIIISGSINLTVNSATVCAGSSTTLNASGASSYTWNTGANTNAIIVSPSVSTQYTVIATASGCNGTFTANASVFVNSLPTVNLSSATSTICQNGGTVSLNGSPSGGTYTGTGVSGATFNPNTAGAGTHSVSYQITGTNGCKNKASITLTVFAIPQVSLAILNGSSAITTSVLCIQWPSFTLNGLPAGGTYTGNGVSGNAFNPSNAGAGTHSISYSYTDANGCSANATRLLNVSVCGGLKDALNNTITIYPQPASGECYVQASAPIQALDIFNASGQKIYYERGHGNFEQRCTLHLPEGLYWIQVTQTNGIVLRKALIISHSK